MCAETGESKTFPFDFSGDSSDLSKAEVVTHTEGLVWVALRASGAMPVLGPPLLMDGRILIDGVC